MPNRLEAISCAFVNVVSTFNGSGAGAGVTSGVSAGLLLGLAIVLISFLLHSNVKGLHRVKRALLHHEQIIVHKEV